MSSNPLTRRTVVGSGALTPALAAGEAALEIDPAPRYELSPFLYMQFMEPLGATDGSVEAAWDHRRNDWREDVVRVTRDLAPTMLRWGGIFTDYYRWREGVGPREKRPMLRNLLWGGVESNQVGTLEFVDFARRVGAEPLLCVNFESDGRKRYQHDGFTSRRGDAREAADWVAYCNHPSNAERRSHGRVEALPVKYWQIGNETSYDPDGFALDAAARKTAEFARAMKQADSSIRLIGWGGEDHAARRSGRAPDNWTRGIAEAVGEHLDYLAFHHMYNPDDPKEPTLEFLKYRENPARTWDVLMDAWKAHEAKIREARDRLGGLKIPLAMTECHFSIPGRHRNEVMSTWACGVAYARLLHVHERHGDVLKIATAADFCGTRWQVNAVMIPVPGGESFLMPVAHVMKLYRRFTGQQALRVVKTPPGLDVTASRSGDRIWLHIANINRTHPVKARIQVAGRTVRGGAVHTIAADPMLEVHERSHGTLAPKMQRLSASEVWTFPAASVSVVEIESAART